MVQIARTITFDLYTHRLQSLFRIGSKDARPYCFGIKALYTSHSISTMMECQNIIGNCDVDIVHTDRTLNMIQFANLVNLFHQRDVKRSKELMSRLDRMPKNFKDLDTVLEYAGTLAIKASVAHLEYTMIRELAEISTTHTSPINQLVLLDALTKLQDDMGWMVAHQLINEDMANHIPFMIVDLSTTLSTHIVDIVEALR
ncbi:hypothetical protein SAMD00019534_079290 [Acytostelium subglobosum LB1]|uniref:hypothetical protein n=1 Tax=Acytostelium subglobosum LB1 TaxID=1410327 RepID=UPI000644EF1A|nr:hypothetical protein SAMD00019534_079290 [Acytostelium subglobosum LB1]GAM24754.1 hypothetical protein SAMD00019534_079290 [Acytostelium subglobosum LB1]|eukprot:XP_012752423.1 hypothetical protein SAMD00019534_079290 [Acytostelium subglobosum LB1]